MKMGFSLLLATLTVGTVAAKSPDGLVLDFRAGESVELLAVSVADYVAYPAFHDGPSWSLSVEAASARAPWTRRIPPPRTFHGAAEGGVRFSVVVPRPLPGSQAVLRDANGNVIWTRTIDTGLIAQADREGSQVRHQLASAYGATAKLMRSTPARLAPPRSDVPRYGGPGSLDDEDAAGAPAAGSTKVAAADGPTFLVSGRVDVDHLVLIRAYDANSGRFVLSTRQEPSLGQFELPLPAGSYVFEVDDNLMNFDHVLLYRTPTRTAPTRISADTTLPDIVPDDAGGDFVLSATLPCPKAQPPLTHFAVVATSADGARIERLIPADTATPPDPAGNCIAQYRLKLSPGTYAVEAAPLGWESRRYGALRIAENSRLEQAETFSAAERTLIWRGQVVAESGQPIPSILRWHNKRLIDDKTFEVSTDSLGRFETPYRRGWTAQFEPSDGEAYDSAASTIVVIGDRAPPSSIVLHDLAFQSVDENGLLRLYGDGNRRARFNILFLGDGYAQAREAYVDTNGNGRWDGFAWQDLDRNGVVSDGDVVTPYGSPTPDPLPNGSVPADFSEPFTDLNGDGVLSRDDGALFHRSAREFMRALLGSDVWNAHRDAFNAYALFEPSEQAGYSIVSASGDPILTRRTRYGSTLERERRLLSADEEAFMHSALAALPDVDLVVLLINQPVLDNARGSVVRASPGSMLWNAGFNTDWSIAGDGAGPAHEMGHFVGSLCDEYSEFPGVHPLAGNTSSRCPNASYSADLADVPWASWLAADAQIPARDLTSSLGVYEGAHHYPGGAYRPSIESMMRNHRVLPIFNAPSRAALEQAIARRTQSWRAPVHSGRPVPRPLPQRD